MFCFQQLNIAKLGFIFWYIPIYQSVVLFTISQHKYYLAMPCSDVVTMVTEITTYGDEHTLSEGKWKVKALPKVFLGLDKCYNVNENTIIKTHHLQKWEVTKTHIVKVHFHFGPVKLGVVHGLAFRLVVDQGCVVDVTRPVDALSKFTSEKVDSHDAENEPEDQAHQQNVHDGWDGPDQSIHDHLDNRNGDIIPYNHISTVV